MRKREKMLISPSGIGCGGELVELEKYFTHFFGDKLKRDNDIGVSIGEKGRGLSEESLSSTMTFFFSSSTPLLFRKNGEAYLRAKIG